MGRVLGFLTLAFLAVAGTIYLLRDSAPGLWADFRCLPSHLSQENLPFDRFIQSVQAGHVQQILLNPEQARAYFQDSLGRAYMVKLPELDTRWLDILADNQVRVITLAPGSC